MFVQPPPGHRRSREGRAFASEDEVISEPARPTTRSVASRPAPPLARVPGRSARATHVHRSGCAAALPPL